MIKLTLVLALWLLSPLLLLALLPVPGSVRLRAAASIGAASFRSLLAMVPDLLAPLVVPIALLQTKREDDALPSWARWWDNDASINGDQLEGAPTYYAPGHDRRSFWARYVWLGWRNRASRAALDLGHRYAPGEYDDAQHWGDPLVGRDREGWTLNRRGPVWQLYMVKRLGRLCIRINCGHKVWANEGDRRPVAMVVHIPFSLLRWRGQR